MKVRRENRVDLAAQIIAYACDPKNFAGDVRKLRGVDALRIRAGPYRVIFTVRRGTLTILNMGQRGDIYKRWMEMKLTRPQIIETATGEKLAVVPLAEYEAMVRAAEAAEDAADTVVARAALADLASGVDEIMPGDVTDRLVAGDNPVRVWRAYRGLTATALAKRASITQAYLSQIETGKRDGTLTVMAVLARELGVDLDDLVPVAQRPGD